MASSTPTLSDEYLIEQTQMFVKAYMAQPQFDASHDYSHILRVLALSKHLLAVEKTLHPLVNLDETVITLSALLHDVSDRKYLPPPAPAPSANDPLTPYLFLRSIFCPSHLASAVQNIISSISYSTEIHAPSLVEKTLHRHPELAIVQDADRLDALGAVGIGRAFTFGGAKGDVTEGMERTIDHFKEKLEKLQTMMKTDEGRGIAKERTRRLLLFREWWDDECGHNLEGKRGIES